jgi:hypothetical protein
VRNRPFLARQREVGFRLMQQMNRRQTCTYNGANSGGTMMTCM